MSKNRSTAKHKHKESLAKQFDLSSNITLNIPARIMVSLIGRPDCLSSIIRSIMIPDSWYLNGKNTMSRNEITPTSSLGRQEKKKGKDKSKNMSKYKSKG